MFCAIFDGCSVIAPVDHETVALSPSPPSRAGQRSAADGRRAM